MCSLNVYRMKHNDHNKEITYVQNAINSTYTWKIIIPVGNRIYSVLSPHISTRLGLYFSSTLPHIHMDTLFFVDIKIYDPSHGCGGREKMEKKWRKMTLNVGIKWNIVLCDYSALYAFMEHKKKKTKQIESLLEFSLDSIFYKKNE